MTTTNPNAASRRRAIASAWPGPGQEAYEQLLALADTIGAACAEAAQRLNSAYTEACQKLTHSPGEFQDGLTTAQQTMLGAMSDPSSLTSRAEDLQDRVLALGDNLAEMGIEVALAYTGAVEAATLAMAKCQAQFGAASQNDLVKSATATAADLLQKVARAGATTVREMTG